MEMDVVTLVRAGRLFISTGIGPITCNLISHMCACLSLQQPASPPPPPPRSQTSNGEVPIDWLTNPFVFPTDPTDAVDASVGQSPPSPPPRDQRPNVPEKGPWAMRDDTYGCAWVGSLADRPKMTDGALVAGFGTFSHLQIAFSFSSAGDDEDVYGCAWEEQAEKASELCGNFKVCQGSS